MPTVLSWNFEADELLQFFDVVQRKYFLNITAQVFFLCQFFRGQEANSLLLMCLHLKSSHLIRLHLLNLLYNKYLYLLFKVKDQRKTIKLENRSF